MSYIHPSWNYQAHSGLPMDHGIAYDPTMVPPPMMHHHPMDGYLYPHPPMEMLDYYHQPIMDYDEYAENLSRPRLTKEQVETLEAQFQAHPKPSSNVKRQLAAQTNLSLPRVANWFQNRRAKAKQQKRQEEFEKMQKAKAEAEEAARQNTGATDKIPDSRRASAVKEESEESTTPKAETTTTTSSEPASTSVNSKGDAKTKKHQKTKSESAREATFASLQRALNAACAARDRFTGRRGSKHEPAQEDEPISPTSTSAPKSQENKSQMAYEVSYPDWQNHEQSTSWARSHGQDEDSSCQVASEMSTSQSVPERIDAFAGTHYPVQSGEWVGHAKNQLPGPGGSGYHDMQYPMDMQTPDISVTRRESSSALGALDGIGIHTGESGMPQSSGRVGGASWKETGKELDLAARRKRPRPAAIGTSNPRSLATSTSMASLSPKSRIPSSAGAGNPMRHSKSAQCLNARYAGVRKASAAQRSPLNFTFAESGSMKASKAEMLRPSVSSTTLAPPTPLTPQDFQNFLPASPTDTNYCLSAHSTTQFFPSSQSMQVNIASPPATPLDIYSPFPYQHAAPPMSAPAQVSTFAEYVSCDSVPVTARSWADTGSLTSPDFQSGLQVPHSSTVSPVAFEAAVDHPGQAYGMDPVSGSPSLIYSVDDADLQAPADADQRKQTEFMMHDYEQHDPRFAALHMGHRAKGYAFGNNTTQGHYPS